MLEKLGQQGAAQSYNVKILVIWRDHSETMHIKNMVHGFSSFSAFTPFISNEILFVTQIYKADKSDILIRNLIL